MSYIDNYKKYIEDDETDIRLKFLIAYLCVEDSLNLIDTKESINKAGDILNSMKNKGYKTPIKEPINWINYLRLIKNTISHKYLTKTEFLKLLKNFQYFDIPTHQFQNFKFDEKYDFSIESDINLFLLNILCFIKSLIEFNNKEKLIIKK